MVFHGYDPAMADLFAGEDVALSEGAARDETLLLPLGMMLFAISVIALFALT